MVYFKEFNFEPSATGLENTTAPNLSPPQQATVESGTNEKTPLDGSEEANTSLSSSRPEMPETESVHPSYAGVHEIKQGPSSSQEHLTEPGPMIINGDVGSTGLNERPSFGNSEIDRKLNSLEPVSSNTEGAPLYEGSNINSINFRPHNLGSEHGNTDARPSYESSNPTEPNARPGIDSSSAKETSSYERQEEKDARLEAFAKLPMSDEVPTKIQEPPGLSYVLPMNDKVSAEKPLQSPIKLPPTIALITPKRGIKRIPYLLPDIVLKWHTNRTKGSFRAVIPCDREILLADYSYKSLFFF